MKILLKLAAVAVMGVCAFDIQAMQVDLVDNTTAASQNERAGERLIKTDSYGTELPEYERGMHRTHECFQHFYRSFSDIELENRYNLWIDAAFGGDLEELRRTVNLENLETLEKAAQIETALDYADYDINQNIGAFSEWWWHNEDSLEAYEFMRNLISNKLQNNLNVTNANDLLTSLQSVDNAAGAEVLPAFFGNGVNSLINKLSRGETNLTVNEQRTLLLDMRRFRWMYIPR